jgi:hypothetical protein
VAHVELLGWEVAGKTRLGHDVPSPCLINLPPILGVCSLVCRALPPPLPSLHPDLYHWYIMGFKRFDVLTSLLINKGTHHAWLLDHCQKGTPCHYSLHTMGSAHTHDPVEVIFAVNGMAGSADRFPNTGQFSGRHGLLFAISYAQHGLSPQA